MFGALAGIVIEHVRREPEAAREVNVEAPHYSAGLASELRPSVARKEEGQRLTLPAVDAEVLDIERAMGRDKADSLDPVEKEVAGAEVIDSKIEFKNGGREWIRSRLVRRQNQSRLVRVVEAWGREDGSDTGVCLSREMFLADQLIIRAARGVDVRQLRTGLNAIGMQLGVSIAEGVFISTVSESSLESVPKAMALLADHPDLVDISEPDGVGFGSGIPNDSFFDYQWALRNSARSDGSTGVDVGASEFWDVAGQAPGVVVAILDTGLNFKHPDLSHVEWINPKENGSNGIDDDGNGKVDDTRGWNFVSDNNDPTDDYGHGSNVAGIIAARRGNGYGMAGLLSDVQVLPCKILDAKGSGVTSALVAATTYVRKMGVTVINMSLQNYPFSNLVSAEFDACEAAGILICAAAGNQGSDNDKRPNYPSCYKHSNVIAVGNHDAANKRSESSNYGNKSVHVFAPGTEILSTVLGADFQYYTGTSQAAPFVTAAAAAIKYANPSWSAAEIKSSILRSCIFGDAYKGFCSSGGRLSIRDALFHAVRQVPLAIQKQSGNITVTQGQPAVFTVQAGGSNPIAYEWRRNNIPLSGSIGPLMLIGEAQTSDAGSYTVVVTNPAGSVTSEPMKLSVNVPASIQTQPVSVAVAVGEVASFCVAAIGTEPLSYQWRKDGVAIPGATSSSFNFAKVKEFQSGSYDVVVANLLGAVTSLPATLKVIVPSFVVIQPNAVAVNVGESASFSVLAGGTEPLHYQWRRDGVAISGANSAVLIVPVVTRFETGSYDVVVSNSAGEAVSRKADLFVNSPVVITQQPAGMLVEPGTPAKLAVKAKGTVPMAYQWRRNGVPIPGATREEYLIAAVTSASASAYDVVITNPAGSVSSSVVEVSMRNAVAIQANPMSERFKTGAEALFFVEATGAGELHYQWRKNGVPVSGANASKLHVSRVSHRDLGRYDVVVSNAFSSAVSTQAALSVDGMTVRGYSSVISMDVPFAGSSGEPVTAQLYLRTRGTSLEAVGPVMPVPGAVFSLNLRKVTVSGDYVVRFSRTEGANKISAWDSVPFGVNVVSGEDCAGVYETLVEAKLDEAPDGATYRGLLQLTVTRSGVVSGRLRYIEAVPVAGHNGAGNGGRTYIPVNRTFSGAFVSSDADQMTYVYSSSLGFDDQKGRQALSLELNFRPGSLGLSGQVTDKVSANPAEWTLLTRKNMRPLVPYSRAPRSSTEPVMGELAGRYTLLSDRMEESVDNFGYVQALVGAAGRVLWMARFPGHKASGSSTLCADDFENPSLEVLHSQRVFLVGGASAVSVLGRLCFTRDETGVWRFAAGSHREDRCLERHANDAERQFDGPPSTTLSQGSDKVAWNGVRKVYFRDNESVRWSGVTPGGVPSFFSPGGPEGSMLLVLDDPEVDEQGRHARFAWNVSVIGSGVLKTVPAAGSGSPWLNLRLDKFGEMRGEYFFRGGRRLLFGAAVPSASLSQAGRGWIEKGAVPTVQRAEWLLQTK